MHLINGEFRASDIIKYDTDIETVMMVLYALIYGAEHGYEFIKLENVINHCEFTMNDFMLKEVM
jgi:hypothetical protein